MPEATSQNRRASDVRIDAIEARIASVEKKVDENTVMTTEVRDILATFRIAGLVAKWLTVIAGAVTAVFGMVAGGWALVDTILRHMRDVPKLK